MRIQLSNGDELRITFWYEPRITVAIIETPEFVAQGEAFLSIKDNFSKRVGRKIALARAMKQVPFEKPVRTEIWDKLFLKGMKP